MRIRLDLAGDRIAQRLADIEAGRVTPVAPRQAATVIVLRPADAPSAGAVEVLMLRRVAAMKFAPGAYVYPGGSVDPADSDPGIGWHGPDPAEFGARLGVSAELARALVCAAVRETFEESGLLLAGPAGGSLATLAGADWESDRSALTDGAVTLAQLLSRRDLVVRADLLVPWARWITPEGEPRRFDTSFFAAALPPGQVATGHAAESDRIAWVRPADAIAAARAGEMALFPPTMATLHGFALTETTAASAAVGPVAGSVTDSVAGSVTDLVAGLLAAPPLIEPILPRLAQEDGAAWVYLPDEVGYPL